MEFDPNLRKQPSSSWWTNRSTSTGHDRRFMDNNNYEYGASTPYYQIGEARRPRGLIGMWKRMFMRRSNKKKVFEPNAMGSRGVSPYDPCTYMQNFDRGSGRMEPENLSRSFSAQFANPSGFLQRMR